MRTTFNAILLSLCAAFAPAQAQQAAKIPRVGFLAPQVVPPLFEVFPKGLAEVGYVKDRSVVIEP